MADENSTANQTVGNIKDTTPNVFFNAAWQLALNLEFHLRFAVIAVGVFGAAANALVIYALIAHHMHDTKKRAVNLLIINQNLLDFACCLLLAISFSTDHLYLKGTLGYIVCVLFTNSTLSEGVLCGSIINLVAVTVERYLKVVHPFWSKKYLKRRMIYAAIGFAWIGGAVFVTPMSIIWSRVETGFCFSYYNLSTDWSYESCRFVFFSVFPLAIFIYCYGRMVVVMKRQMRVMAGHNAEGSAQMNASQAQSQRVKWNIIKTMMIVGLL